MTVSKYTRKWVTSFPSDPSAPGPPVGLWREAGNTGKSGLRFLGLDLNFSQLAEYPSFERPNGITLVHRYSQENEDEALAECKADGLSGGFSTLGAQLYISCCFIHPDLLRTPFPHLGLMLPGFTYVAVSPSRLLDHRQWSCAARHSLQQVFFKMMGTDRGYCIPRALQQTSICSRQI